ncbi:MAG: hypothetical protein O7J95_16955 [Planctomycetota bacterium]|nr:hypothetical protein [Planctomycetota bacterium]
MLERCEIRHSFPTQRLPKKRRRGRKAALIAGLALAVSLGTAAFFWVDIATRYYLQRVRNDPTYFVKIIEASDRPIARRVLLAVLDTAQGREALHRAFVYGILDLLRGKYKLESPVSMMEEEAGGCFIVRDDAFVWLRPSRVERCSVFLFDDSALYHLMKLREKIDGRVVTLPECPRLRFRFDLRQESSEHRLAVLCRPEIVESQ